MTIALHCGKESSEKLCINRFKVNETRGRERKLLTGRGLKLLWKAF